MKNDDKQITRHHRQPKHSGGSDDPTNISLVTRKKHEAFHTLFGDGNVNTICKVLNNVWIDPKYAVVVVERTQIHLLSKLLK